MCIIPEDIPVNIVFNRIQDIFILYDQWNQSLMDSRLRNASIQELLDLTASIIPNPMMLIGMDFTIIASRDWNLSDLFKAGRAGKGGGCIQPGCMHGK